MTVVQIQAIIAKIEAAILASPLADTVTVDGTSVKMRDAEAQLSKWEERLTKARSRKPVIASMRLDGVL